MQGIKSKLFLVSALTGFLLLTAFIGAVLWFLGNSNKKAKSQEEQFSELVALRLNTSLQ